MSSKSYRQVLAFVAFDLLHCCGIRWAATSFAPHDQLYAQKRSKSEGLNQGSGSLICWIWSLKSARSSAKLMAA
jgi:hypothetical protein